MISCCSFLRSNADRVIVLVFAVGNALLTCWKKKKKRDRMTMRHIQYIIKKKINWLWISLIVTIADLYYLFTTQIIIIKHRYSKNLRKVQLIKITKFLFVYSCCFFFFILRISLMIFLFLFLQNVFIK